MSLRPGSLISPGYRITPPPSLSGPNILQLFSYLYIVLHTLHPPPRPTCQWFKDGAKLTEKSHQINNKERTLTLKSASPEDNGLYYCCAKNAAGHVCSSSNFTLNIIGAFFKTPSPHSDPAGMKGEECSLYKSALLTLKPSTGSAVRRGRPVYSALMLREGRKRH